MHYLDLALAVACDARIHDATPVSNDLQAMPPEARYRCAVSRAYYASFHACRAYIKTNAPSYPLPTDGKEHGDVRKWFVQSQDATEQKVGRNLKRLAEWRRFADYENPAQGINWHQTASGALQLAEFICQNTDVD
jgi:uncharacterized protein (UPF0332 family)